MVLSQLAEVGAGLVSLGLLRQRADCRPDGGVGLVEGQARPLFCDRSWIAPGGRVRGVMGLFPKAMDRNDE